MKPLDYLPKTFLFRDLTTTELQQVASFCTLSHLSRHANLFMEGDKATAFYIVLEGRVKLYKLTLDGTEQILGIFGPGHLVAEAAIFDIGTYPAYCQTLENSTLVRIAGAEFVQLLQDKPAISLKVIHGYSRRLRYFVNLVEELTLKDIKARLAHYLLDHSEESGDALMCALHQTKRELASTLGTTPETLSRTLRHFKEHQLIDEEKDRFIIVNTAGLQAHLG